MKGQHYGLVCAILLASVFFSIGCGKKTGNQMDPREMQMQNLQAKMTAMEAAVSDMQAQLNQAKSIQMQFGDRISAVQNSLNQVQSSIAESRNALNTLSQVEEQQAGNASKGWPWPVRIILILALLVIFYFLWRKVVRGGDEEDDGAEDDYTVENQMGSVRYPGSKSASSHSSKE